MGRSALIFAYDEPDGLRQVMESVRGSSVSHIVVAAGGGADTVEVLRSLASQGISVLFERERLGKAAAYNRAIGSVRGDAVVIVNSDVVVEPETIDLLLSSVEGGCDISFPRIVPDRSRGFWSRVSSVLWDLQDVRIRTLMGKGMVPSSGEVFAIRSGHLRPIPEVINDDAYIFARVAREGGTLCYLREAEVVNFPPSSPRDIVMQRRRVILGHMQLLSLGTYSDTSVTMLLSGKGVLLTVMLEAIRECRWRSLYLFPLLLLEAISFALALGDLRRGRSMLRWPIVRSTKIHFERRNL
ncbi:hypothetical protein GCM10007108_08300 [Thermogymnomonas acidicola]|uniref:Glycosyltransferase 2-like domain-containing protein n=1 Tax=Thermogymnomonas acidicola TaxID=399579 RepID=A0AA37BR29_9ARCH|nr:glycosyltransferase [Thermogymnomonas acidicola]GGM72520.1 hypothetical protein GCM10007108_08300 [Thermogymnomonas acidicola]